MSSGKGGSKSSTTTVKVPKYLEKELEYGLQQARGIYNKGAPAYFPDQTYANFDPLQQEAMDKTVQLARDGSPIVTGAQNWAADTFANQSGANPYLDQMLAKLSREANQQVNANFNKNGRFGSGSNVATASKAITDAQVPYLFDQFNNDQALKTQLASIAPGLADYDYGRAAKIGAVGDAQQAMTQQGIDEDRSRYEYDATKKSQWLDQYLARVNGSAANQLTSETQKQSSGGGGLLGAVGTGLSIASLFTPGGPIAGLAGMGSAGGFGMGQAIGSMFSSSPTGPYLPYGFR
jgi:hypothetical protein